MASEGGGESTIVSRRRLSFSRSVGGGLSVGRSVGRSFCRTRDARPRFRNHDHAGSVGRILRADRSQIGTRRAYTGLQAIDASRVPGHRGGRAVRTVVWPEQA